MAAHLGEEKDKNSGDMASSLEDEMKTGRGPGQVYKPQRERGPTTQTTFKQLSKCGLGLLKGEQRFPTPRLQKAQPMARPTDAAVFSWKSSCNAENITYKITLPLLPLS